MKRLRITGISLVLLMAAGFLVGCGRDSAESSTHGHEEKEGKGEGHGHEEEPAGASFKPGKGVLLTEETRKVLGVEVAEVTEKKLPREIQFAAQVYRNGTSQPGHTSGKNEPNVKAAGFIPREQASFVREGQSVRLTSESGVDAMGKVSGVHKSIALGDIEVDIALSSEPAAFKPGEFLRATLVIPRDEMVTVIPRSALLTTAEGTFAYVVNGDAYFRTLVKRGAEAEGWVEITDGLLPGDQVTTKPVETLWLIELRATKGGGHSH